MSNSQQLKKGLSVRDLITTGILAALYMVCAMIGEAIFGFFPVLTFLCPLSIALLCGPVYMLILAKVPKHGPIIVTGILVGGVLFVLGMYWSMCLAYCILGVVADLLAGFGGPILWVSHDLGECYRNCKTVCVMENGVSSPVTDMKTLVQHPATQGAARLAGCRNFLPTRRCGDGVRIDGWDITLPLKADAEQVTVAIPDSAIALGDGPYTARVFRVIQDLETSVVLLQPEHAPDAVMLRAAAADIGSATPGEAIAFRLQAEKCLCY